MNHTACLVLEASTGVLGPDAQILAEELCKVLGHRAELLEAAKRLLSNKRGEDDWLILATHCHDLQEVIDRAEGKA